VRFSFFSFSNTNKTNLLNSNFIQNFSFSQNFVNF
jgi:hypothetical protein